jgi:hypothetical protein
MNLLRQITTPLAALAAAILTGSAPAATAPAPPPEITGLSVSDIEATSAALAGLVNPKGNKTTGAFEVRPVGSKRWFKGDRITVPTGLFQQSVRRTVENLRPHTPYEWRLSMRNKGGTATVSGTNFTTPNRSPVVSDDRVTIGATGGTIDVLGNDSDPDGDTLKITAVSGGSKGTLTRNDTSVIYTPGAGFDGHDTFTYTVTDATAPDPLKQTASATVDVINLDLGAVVLASTVRSHKSSRLSGAGGAISSLSVPSIASTGQLAFSGKSGAAKGKRFVAAGSPPKIVATQKKVAPGAGGLLFKSFLAPVIGGNGAVAFIADLEGRGATRAGDEGLWTNLGGTLALVAREGDPIPNSQTITYKAFRAVSIQGNEVVFVADLTGGVTSLTDTAVFVWAPEFGTKRMIREGDPFTVSAGDVRVIGSLSMLTSSAKSPGQGRGHPADGLYILSATFVDGSSALVAPVKGANGTFTFGIAALSQAALPGLAGVAPERFGNPAVTDTDIVGFRARVMGLSVPHGKADGLFVENAPNYTALAYTGQSAPGITGATFSRFFDPVFNSAGDTAWVASVKGAPPGTNEGLWVRKSSASSATLIARKGTPISGRNNSVWRSIRSVALPDDTGPVFVATARVTHSPVQKLNQEGIWSYDSNGALRLILTRGDRITMGRAIKTVRHFSVLGRVNGSPDSPRAYERIGQVVCLVTFDDRQQAVLAIPLI